MAKSAKFLLIVAIATGCSAKATTPPSIATDAAALDVAGADAAVDGTGAGDVQTVDATTDVAVPADVADPDAVAGMVASTVEKFGRLDIMVANAGLQADAPSLDALYDLKNDPNEITNLIGINPDREKHRAEAERMKNLLVAWLTRIKSPYLEGVKARPVIGAGETPRTPRR